MNGLPATSGQGAGAWPKERRVLDWRWLSLAVEFGLLPVAVGWLVPPQWWLPTLWLVAALAGWWLQRRALEPARADWRPVAWTDERTELNRIVARYAGGVLLAIAVVTLWMPDHLFDFPRQRTGLWLAVMVLYPLLSVYPQELLFRRYFFARYHGLLGPNWLVALASAAAFGWMHLIFRNEWAIGLTLIGGWLFADTYRRTGSLWLVCLEHALYGNLIFTVGLGRFVFHGAVRT